MPDSNEPEKYTIDEIMDRLKKRPGEADDDPGELVTRPDGSQAIRVRKRKRRSHQPHKEELARIRRMRMVQVGAVLLLLVAAGIIAGGAMVFANSPVFRERLLTGTAIKTGATVEMREFRMNPKTANAEEVSMEWPQGNVLRHLLLRKLNAEIHPVSFMGRALVGDEIMAGQAELVMDVPVEGQALGIDRPEGTPMDIRFKRYASNRVGILVGSKASPLLRLSDAEFSLHTMEGGNRSQLLLNRGSLSIPNAPVWRIARGHMEFRGRDLDVVGLRLLHETDNRGELKLSGIVHPYDAGKVSTLAVELDSFAFDGLVGERLGKVFSGRVDTAEVARSNFFSFTPVADPKGVLAVTFQSSLATPFEVNGFPAFHLLARLLEDKWFERPIFESDVTGTVRRADNEVIIADLECENRSRIAIKANLRMGQNRQISGTMRLGIAETMLKSVRNSRLERVFADQSNAFRWVELTVTGRGDAPLDNLQALYDAAPADVLDNGGQVPKFEDLTSPD